MGKTDPKYGESFDLNDEIQGLFGYRPVQSNPEKGLVFMTTRFGRQLKNANNLFNAELLRGGRVTSDKLLNTYEYAESRKFAEMKEMNQNIEAARKLGVPENTIRQKVKRQGINKQVFKDLMRGTYTPAKPTDFFINRINEITRDLNQKEGVVLPNPYFEALPTINKIINTNRNIDLQKGRLNFEEIKPIEEIQIEETIKPLNVVTGVSSVANITPQVTVGDNQLASTQQKGQRVFGSNDPIFGE